VETKFKQDCKIEVEITRPHEDKTTPVFEKKLGSITIRKV
jgi:hypothetical protein